MGAARLGMAVAARQENDSAGAFTGSACGYGGAIGTLPDQVGHRQRLAQASTRGIQADAASDRRVIGGKANLVQQGAQGIRIPLLDLP